MLQRSSSLPSRVRCSGRLATLLRQLRTQGRENGQLYRPFSLSLSWHLGRRAILAILMFLYWPDFSSRFFMPGFRALSGWFLSMKNTWLVCSEADMSRKTSPICVQNILLALSPVLSKACFREMFFILWVSSSMRVRLISSLEMDHILKEGSKDLRMSSITEVFPEDGMLTGMRTSTFFRVSALFYYFWGLSVLISFSLVSDLSYSSYSPQQWSEFTISMNFSLGMFFSSSRRKSMNLLLINLEIGLFWA